MLSLALALLAPALAGDGGFDHSHAAFDAVLSGAVSAAGVDYPTLASRRPAMDAYLLDIAEADISGFSRSQTLAFFINAYNGYTLQLILDNPSVASIRDLDGGDPWGTRTFPVAGESLTLNQMEHGRVRSLGDARIHGAVNCASKGCPPLSPRAFRATGVDAQLDEAARRWVGANAYSWQGQTLLVNEIFTWYDEDFVAWAAAHDVSDTSEHADTVAFLTAYGADFTGHPESASELSIQALPYDWSLNKR